MVRRALFYPLFVLVLLGVVWGVLNVLVIPQYSSLFNGFGADLPALTKFFFDLGTLLSELVWWGVALVIVGIILSGVSQRLFSFARSVSAFTPFGLFFSWLGFKTPFVGKLFRTMEHVRYLRTWSFSLSEGASINQAVEHSQAVVKTLYYSEALQAVGEGLESGSTLTEALKNRRGFPGKVIQASAVAARVEHPAEVFARLADIYSRHLVDSMEPVSRRLHVLFVIFTGMVVGLFILAMYLPIFRMGSLT